MDLTEGELDFSGGTPILGGVPNFERGGGVDFSPPPPHKSH